MKDIGTRDMLQKYIPTILENDAYFEKFVFYLLDQYNFKVDVVHLRKKLGIYLEESYRTDSVALAQRLIRGEFMGEDKVHWIWLSSKEIAFITKNTVSSILTNDNIL